MLLIQILPLVCYYIFHNCKYTAPLFLAFTYNVLLLSIAVKIYTFLLGIEVDVKVYNTTCKRYVGNICICISSADFYVYIPSETSDMSLITHHTLLITHQTLLMRQGVFDLSHTHTHPT